MRNFIDIITEASMSDDDLYYFVIGKVRDLYMTRATIDGYCESGSDVRDFCDGLDLTNYQQLTERGALMVFDAHELDQSFKLIKDGFGPEQQSEQEERVDGPLTNVSRFLKKVIYDKDDLAKLITNLKFAETSHDSWVREEVAHALEGVPLLLRYVNS